MTSMLKIRKKINGKEEMNRYLNLFEKACPEFSRLKSDCEKACRELGQSFEGADRLIEYNNSILETELEYAFNRGIEDNLAHFEDPCAPTFLDNGYALAEEGARQATDAIAAERRKLLANLPIRLIRAYDVIAEYTAFLETYIPKLAHYYGFMCGTTYLASEISDYKADPELCREYGEWLSEYLELKLEV